MSKQMWIMVGMVALLVVALTISIISLSREKSRFKDFEQLYDSINDDLHSWKDKDSINMSKIKIMQTEKVGDFITLKHLDGLNLELQDLVKKQQKEIKSLTAALIMESETSYTDTIRSFYPLGGDTIIFSESILMDVIDNAWISSLYGFNKGKSHFELYIRNKYEVTFGLEGKTLFKKGVPYANVKNLNPYTSTRDIRVYQVSVPREKRWGIAIQAGYGGLFDVYHKRFGYGAYLGLGVNYNLISW